MGPADAYASGSAEPKVGVGSRQHAGSPDAARQRTPEARGAGERRATHAPAMGTRRAGLCRDVRRRLRAGAGSSRRSACGARRRPVSRRRSAGRSRSAGSGSRPASGCGCSRRRVTAWPSEAGPRLQRGAGRGAAAADRLPDGGPDLRLAPTRRRPCSRSSGTAREPGARRCSAQLAEAPREPARPPVARALARADRGARCGWPATCSTARASPTASSCTGRASPSTTPAARVAAASASRSRAVEARLRRHRILGGADLFVSGRLLEAGVERGSLELLGSRKRGGSIEIALATTALDLGTLAPYLQVQDPPLPISGTLSGYIGSKSDAPGESELEVDLVRRRAAQRDPGARRAGAPRPFEVGRIDLAGFVDVTPEQLRLRELRFENGRLRLETRRPDRAAGRPRLGGRALAGAARSRDRQSCAICSAGCPRSAASRRRAGSSASKPGGSRASSWAEPRRSPGGRSSSPDARASSRPASRSKPTWPTRACASATATT